MGAITMLAAVLIFAAGAIFGAFAAALARAGRD
jgi:hypothetical protein